MSASRREIYRAGYTYVVTRRIVQFRTKTVLRVRVVCYKGLALKSSTPVWNKHQDYVHLAEGDKVFHGHIAKIGNTR